MLNRSVLRIIGLLATKTTADKNELFVTLFCLSLRLLAQNADRTYLVARLQKNATDYTMHLIASSIFFVKSFAINYSPVTSPAGVYGLVGEVVISFYLWLSAKVAISKCDIHHSSSSSSLQFGASICAFVPPYAFLAKRRKMYAALCLACYSIKSCCEAIAGPEMPRKTAFACSTCCVLKTGNTTRCHKSSVPSVNGCSLMFRLINFAEKRALFD